MWSRCLWPALWLFIGVSVVHVLDAHAEPTTGSSTGSRPARLLEQADLTYPAAAAELNLHGDVTVVVDVDPAGAVTAAVIEAGHEVFHDAATQAAMGLTFDPASEAGKPVPTRIRVFFHFAPPEQAVDHDPIEIIVHASNPDREDIKARTTLDEAALEQATGQDLAQTVTQVAGVSMSRGTSDSTKPIIRGQQERRLLVLYDGIRHESQKWGPDHATEIDPFAAGSISVIRGAAGARYGPDAIGGVILVEPPALRDDPGVNGKVVGAFASNGVRPYGAVRLDAGFAGVPGFSVRVEGNYTRGASLRAPDYLLGNTGSEQWNVGSTLQYRWNSGIVRASYHHNDLRAGVFYGVQNSSPQDFEDQLTIDRPPTANQWTQTYAIDRPYQDVTHDIALLHGRFNGTWGSLSANYAYQHNVRREFEQARGSVTGPQYDFTLRTHSLDATWEQPERHLEHAHLTGGLGLQSSFQENVYQGLPLLPNFRAANFGVFGFERLSLHTIDLEIGARYDLLSRTAFLTRQDFERHTRRETLDDNRCEQSGEVARCPNLWHAGSVSLGGLVHVVPDAFDLKVDLSTASRFPNIDEQYLIGSAPSLPVYGLGFPDLTPEITTGGSITLAVRQPWINAEISGFGSYVHNYIAFQPERNDDGSLHFDVTVQGAWPTYAYTPIRAAVYGADGSVSVGPEFYVGIAAQGAVVRQQNVADGTHLVNTPGDNLRAELIVRPPGFWIVRDTELAVTADFVAKQTRSDPGSDFATAPDGYGLLGLSVSTRFKLPDRSMRLGVDAHNLLNARYRDYTSLLRYYADQPGVDVRLRLSIDI